MNTLTPNFDIGLLSSSEMNKMISEVHELLDAKFETFKTEVSKVDNIEKQNSSFIFSTKNKINDLIKQLEDYKVGIQDLNEQTEVLKDHFMNNSFIESSSEVFEEVLQKSISSLSLMTFDNELKQLSHSKKNIESINYDITIVRSNYSPTTGLGDINNIKESTNKSYWYEQVQFEESFTQVSSNHATGIEVKLILTPKRISKMNQIRLRTFSEYPMDMISVSYIDSETEEEIFLQSDIESIEDYFFLNFEEIQIKSIILTMKQMHYEKEDNTYTYELGLYSLNCYYIEYVDESLFMSKQIHLDQDKTIDYYLLKTDDSNDINYSIIEYCEDPNDANNYRIFIKNILQTNLEQVPNEPLTIYNVNNNYVANTKYPFKTIQVIENGVALTKNSDYFAKEDKIVLFNYKSNASYSATYTIEDQIVRKTSGTTLKPIFIRVMAKSTKDDLPSYINSYEIKIKYKGE